jgi:hypothetical protein
MKIVVVSLMLLGAMVAGGAYAAAVPAETSMSKDRSVQAPSKTKKNKSLHGRKPKASGKAGAVKANPKVNRQDSMTETPPESADQSVQLRGVRG